MLSSGSNGGSAFPAGVRPMDGELDGGLVVDERVLGAAVAEELQGARVDAVQVFHRRVGRTELVHDDPDAGRHVNVLRRHQVSSLARSRSAAISAAACSARTSLAPLMSAAFGAASSMASA